MEQSTKTILWILAFITLPITIPLAIISIGMVLTVLFLIMGLVLMYGQELIVAAIVVIIVYGISKWLSRNG